MGTPRRILHSIYELPASRFQRRTCEQNARCNKCGKVQQSAAMCERVRVVCRLNWCRMRFNKRKGTILFDIICEIIIGAQDNTNKSKNKIIDYRF